MTKYDEQFKLKLVKQYLAGISGKDRLAKQHGVGRSVLRRWIAAYEQHGQQGLCKKSSHYSAEFKLTVLQHA
jgi:transposase